MTTSQRFPRSARVRTRADFDCVFKEGKRLGRPILALHWRGRDDGVARLGLAVSRKVDKRAVGRNRIKRIMRELFRAHRGALAAGDYVLVARPGCAARDRLEIIAAALDLLRRAGALPPPATAGTLPPPSPAPTEPAAHPRAG